MRGHQSMVAKLDNIFKPIEPLFEQTTSPSFSGSYAAKRRQEQLTRPLPSVVRYLENENLGSPRTRTEFRLLVSKKPMAANFLSQLKPKTRFITSALREEELPLATLPELAVVGRSNSGKSTLINAIVGTRCCQVMDKPGSTEKLNFYRIGDPPKLVFVDVPGFGFSYSSQSDRDMRNEFALWYLRSRRNLRSVILVVDARHGLSDCDNELISFFKNNKIKYFLVLNKCDLVESKQLAQRITMIGKDLDIPPELLIEKIIPVSALRLVGMEKIRRICEKFKLEKTVKVNGETKHVNDLLEARRLRKTKNEGKVTVSLADFRDEIKGVSGKDDEEQVQEMSSECAAYTDIEPDAYRPDEKSILKRVVEESAEEIRLLEVEDFVSKDEEKNLGLRGGKNRADIPAPSEMMETKYEEQMKLNHSLDWKMRLELDDEHVRRQNRPMNKIERDAAPFEDSDLVSMGFISTHSAGKSPEDQKTPKGIQKWKLPGLKPSTKTTRYRKPRESADRVMESRIHNHR